MTRVKELSHVRVVLGKAKKMIPEYGISEDEDKVPVIMSS